MHKYFFKNYYFINKFNKNNIDKLDNNTTVIYRNYNKKVDEIEILKIKSYCHRKKIKFLISNYFKLALKLKLDGVYIPSFNKSFIHLSYFLKRNFVIIGSAHNVKEIRLKEKQGVESIFISSLFKKNKNFLGVNRFKTLSSLTGRKVIALGGISEENIKKLNLLDIKGFSGITYFDKKKGPLKGPFSK